MPRHHPDRRVNAAAPDHPDGPWRVATQFDVAIPDGTAGAGPALMASLRAAGLPVRGVTAVSPEGLRALLLQSASSGIDLLVLDARAAMDAAAVAELRRVADGDPMIAAVSPWFGRSAAVPESAEAGVTYGLVPDRRGLYLKASAMAEVGDGAPTADPLTGHLLALNRFGFRVATADGARALHPDGPAADDRTDVPADWRPALHRQARGAPALAETLMAGLDPAPDGRRAVAFDLSHAGPRHSGTTWLARALVGRAAARWPDMALHVVATPATFAFHFGALADKVGRIDPAASEVVAALIRIGQPFLWKEIDAAVRRAPVLVLFMLDTIGLDCQYDAPDELDALWRFCFAEVDGLLFNSAFTARQFGRRFALPIDRPAQASPHSLDLADYRLADVPDAPDDGGILVIGNAMPHKRLAGTARLLASAGLGRPVTVLGLPAGAVAGTTCLPSGDVTPEGMAALYAAARVVVYPSVYEGFGFPILDALAHRRPILVRPLAPYAEIAAGLPQAANIRTYAGDADLLRLLRDPPVWTEAETMGPVRGWDDAADDLRAVLDEALRGADRARVIRRIDALRGRMSFMRTLAFGGGDDALDRAAALAGRLAQGLVLRAGRVGLNVVRRVRR